MSRESKKSKKERLERIIAKLEEIYPESACALEYGGDPWRLLVMGRLSAQCTDARVNIVCRELFAAYPDAWGLANAPLSDVERIIRPCGLYHTKAESIIEASRMLCEEYGGVLPDSMDELLKFAGVGRKIANLLLGDIYHKPAIVADTHCIRICGRLGFYPETLKDPYKVELILSELSPPEKQSDFCHRIVQFGRDVCSARSPKCLGCPLGEYCKRNQNSNK
ncbi:MAG: endonuclease III [Clostridia bacterium]|nr:endonuclease III [Clostridia bacterium]